jgi:Vanillate O-demethylase oxygenase C-terminal domain
MIAIPLNLKPGTQPAPRNAWYVVAFGDEVTEKPMSRRILGQRLVLYRGDDGIPVALADYYKVQRFMMPIGGNFQLLHENLLDVTHISFLHEGLFDSGAIAAAPPITTVDGSMIEITRKVTETMNGAFAQQFDLPKGTRVDRSLISLTWGPNLNVITNVLSFPDDPERPPAIRHSPFPITPETETSCHYFAAVAANYGSAPKGEALAKALQATWDIFLTDRVAIESIQDSYREFGAATTDINVRADEAALRFRRLLAEQVARESESQVAT